MRRALGGWIAAALAWVERAGRAAVGLFVLTILVFTFGQVLDRYIFKTTFDAYDQLARLGLVWMTFVGFAVAFRERRTIRVELFDTVLGPAAQKWRETAFDLVILALVALVHIKGWRVVEVGGYQAIIGTPFTYAWSYAAIVAATALLAFFLVVRIARRLLGMPDEPHDRGPPC
jgi:TRAP-type C4-dicarboxylate transport system permease small subunit